LEDLSINIENGQIYDWTNNVWTNEFAINNMGAGLTKTYYVRTQSLDSVICNVYGRVCDKDQQNQVILLSDATVVPNTSETLHLERHVYRYKTLQILYKCQNNKNADLKSELKNHFNNIKQFIENNGLQKDSMMKGLLDDVYMVYKSYETKYSHLFTNLRQRSQGRQNVYNVTTTPFKNNVNIPLVTPMKLRRTPTISIPQNTDMDQFQNTYESPTNWHMVSNDNDDDIMKDHVLTQIQDDYSSPCVLQLMREVSKSCSTDSLE
jgi:hypothetical protein